MTHGIHHVTAIATDPATTLAFYRDLLGLSLVKRTIHFDEPDVHHLFFGAASGAPGTLLTFFVIPDAESGRIGKGQTAQTILAVPGGALDFWRQVLAEAGVETRDGAGGTLAFSDPDGLGLAMIAAGDPVDGETIAGIPPEFAITGIHGVVLASANPDSSRVALTSVLGFGSSPARAFLEAGPSPLRDLVLLHPAGSRAPLGVAGSGTVHHVAFRVADLPTLAAAQAAILEAGFEVTEPIDGVYFHSVFFREPGGVLIELATDAPGLTVDEAPDALGKKLCLPPWLEKHREAIDNALPLLEV